MPRDYQAVLQMPNINNTPYNQQITDAVSRRNTIGEEIKQRYTNQPSYEAGYRASTVGADTGLKDLMGGFSDKVMEMYRYDQQRNAEASGATTMTTEGGQTMTLNPMIQETANQQGFNQTVKEKETAWQLYESRKNLLGSIVDKAMKIYEAETAGKEVDLKTAEKEIDTLMDMWKETNRMSDAQKDRALEEKKLTGTTDDASLYADMIIEGTGDIKDVPIKLRGEVSKILSENEKYDPAGGLYKLGAADKVSAATLLNIYKEASSARDDIGETKPNWLLGGVTGKTGPWVSSIFGTGGPGGDLRVKIDDLTADKINARYGGALTESEIGRLTQWAPSSKEQEAANWTKLNRMAQVAKETFKNKLLIAGYSEADATKKVNELFKASSPTVDEADIETF